MGRTTHQGRNEGLRRVLQLLRRLDGLRYAPSLQVLAEELAVNPRTVRRDLELLESCGLKVPMWRRDERLGDLRLAASAAADYHCSIPKKERAG